MQWNCPHCGTKLSISDDTLGSGWSFSRCYKCAGFALIRKAEINVIKVDKAPPGENIILPEASPSPNQGLISESATRNLAKHMSPEAIARMNEANAQSSNPVPTAPAAEAQVQAISHAVAQTIAQVNSQAPSKNLATNSALPSSRPRAPEMEFRLPDPLPEISFKPRKKITLPIGIVAASVLAIVSGIYFYLQAQTLWEKTRSSATDGLSNAPKNPRAPGSEDDHAALSKPIRTLEVATSTNAPMAPLVQVQPAAPESITLAAAAPQRIITDQIQETATAPMKNLEKNLEPRDSRLLVQVRARRASVHTGPGMEYPVIGTVSADSRYSVIDWSDRWFKLQIRNAKTVASAESAGWVRNDLVRVIPENSSARIAAPQINPTH